MNLDHYLSRGVAEIIVESELRARLAAGTPLRLKMGFDPSSPNLHVGHAVGLRKLRQLQELGHLVVLIVGDWTAQIGDPSGRSATRRALTAEEVRVNADTYLQQFFKVVDRERTEVRSQSEWYGSFTLADLFGLAARFTIQQLLAHETFRNRVEAGSPLTVMETLYPLLQAHDSVVVRADVEFGGTDQKFNILAGRELMRAMGLAPQQVLLTPLLPGLDGRKMGKSFGNTIDLATPPEEMYGRTMALSDELIIPYLTNVTDVPLEEIAELERAMAAGENPRNVKMRLGRELVAQFHGPAAAAEAEAHFKRVIVDKEAPEDMPAHALAGPTSVVEALVASGLAPSKGEARRLIAGGGVRLDGAKVDDPTLVISPSQPRVLQVGKRRFVRLTRSEE
jgi:tyrosyl-tRNA synthetase